MTHHLTNIFFFGPNQTEQNTEKQKVDNSTDTNCFPPNHVSDAHGLSIHSPKLQDTGVSSFSGVNKHFDNMTDGRSDRFPVDLPDLSGSNGASFQDVKQVAI